MGATGRDLHVNVPITKMAIVYRPFNTIAESIAPILTVTKQSNAYAIWDKQDAFMIEDDKRAPGTEANIITRHLSSDTYFAKNYALKDKIPYEDMKNADAGMWITERGERVRHIKDKLYLNMEYRIANQVTSGSNVGSYSAVASAWTDHTNSTPLTDLQTAIDNVEDSTGYKPNCALFARKAWRNFKENDAVIDRIFGSAGIQASGRMVGMEHAKALLELDKVLVGGAQRSTTEEGQTYSLAAIWGDHVLIYYAPPNPSKEVPSFMYGFRWPVIMNMQAQVFQLERAGAEQVQLGYYQDEKITASELGFLVTNVTSST